MRWRLVLAIAVAGLMASAVLPPSANSSDRTYSSGRFAVTVDASEPFGIPNILRGLEGDMNYSLSCTQHPEPSCELGLTVEGSSSEPENADWVREAVLPPWPWSIEVGLTATDDDGAEAVAKAKVENIPAHLRIEWRPDSAHGDPDLYVRFGSSPSLSSPASASTVIACSSLAAGGGHVDIDGTPLLSASVDQLEVGWKCKKDSAGGVGYYDSVISVAALDSAGFEVGTDGTSAIDVQGPGDLVFWQNTFRLRISAPVHW